MTDTAPVVLITGATSGLGRYLARELAASGWQVLAHGRDPARVGFGAPGEGRQVSADGHELRFAVNYLAPVLLTRLLVPRLRRGAGLPQVQARAGRVHLRPGR